MSDESWAPWTAGADGEEWKGGASSVARYEQPRPPEGPCDSPDHFDDCLDSCGVNQKTGEPEGQCGWYRKHWRKGGVSCMSDMWFCRDCDGSFFWEGLHFDGEDPDDDIEWDFNLICHCCRLKKLDQGA